MVGKNLKQETFVLKEKRDAIEAEMNDIIGRLCQPGGPGITGNLLDPEGFPRSDIDISSVRSDRHRLSELRNDYKDITEKINENLQQLLLARHSKNVTSPATDTTVAQGSNNSDVFHSDAMEVEPVDMVPFALVDEIDETSPAAVDGLKVGDQILKFGNVMFGDQICERLASENQSNEGRAVPLIIMRNAEVINLNVTPRPWHGRGLLGCHFQIL